MTNAAEKNAFVSAVAEAAKLATLRQKLGKNGEETWKDRIANHIDDIRIPGLND